MVSYNSMCKICLDMEIKSKVILFTICSLFIYLFLFFIKLIYVACLKHSSHHALTVKAREGYVGKNSSMTENQAVVPNKKKTKNRQNNESKDAKYRTKKIKGKQHVFKKMH